MLVILKNDGNIYIECIGFLELHSSTRDIEAVELLCFVPIRGLLLTSHGSQNALRTEDARNFGFATLMNFCISAYGANVFHATQYVFL